MLVLIGIISFSLIKTFARFTPWGGGGYYAPPPIAVPSSSQRERNPSSAGVWIILLITAIGLVMYNGYNKPTQSAPQPERVYTPVIPPQTIHPLPPFPKEQPPPHNVVERSTPLPNYSSASAFAKTAVEKLLDQGYDAIVLETPKPYPYKILVGNWESRLEASTWLAAHPTIKGFPTKVEP